MCRKHELCFKRENHCLWTPACPRKLCDLLTFRKEAWKHLTIVQWPLPLQCSNTWNCISRFPHQCSTFMQTCKNNNFQCLISISNPKFTEVSFTRDSSECLLGSWDPTSRLEVEGEQCSGLSWCFLQGGKTSFAGVTIHCPEVFWKLIHPSVLAVNSPSKAGCCTLKSRQLTHDFRSLSPCTDDQSFAREWLRRYFRTSRFNPT